MNRFELVRPQSVEEAVAALDANDPTVRPVGGGTALMLMMKQKLFRPSRLVSLQRLESDLRGIAVADDGSLRIGAMTPLRDLELSAAVAGAAPVVTDALHTLANVRVRNQATVGGHLAHGDPHMDLPPILLGMGARVQAVSARGARWIELADLFAGYYETTLAPDELITELAVPAQAADVQGAYVKFTAISNDDWPAMCGAIFFRQEEGKLQDVVVTVSAATEKPLRLTRVEELLTGERPGEALIKAAADLAASEITPLPDIRGSVSYKRELARVFVHEAIQKASQAPRHKGR